MMSKKLKTKFGIAKIIGGYYRITSRKEGNHGKYLHRLIWEDFYGCKIPEGYVIHHRDENKLNNNLDNFELITREEHVSLHQTGKTFSEEHKQNLSESHKGKNTGENNPRAKYTLWDITKCHYAKSNMFNNGNGSGKKPRRCFISKYNDKRLSIGYNLDFYTPELINDLINESLEVDCHV